MLSKNKKINTQLFKEVLNKGKNYHFLYFSVKILRLSIKDESRFTIVVSKKIIKKAILRNLIRRRFFNIINKISRKSPTTPIAIIFFLKKQAGELKFKEFKKELIKTLDEVRLIN